MSNNVWTKLENKNSLMQKGTQYRNMQAWSRPCALCRKDFTAYTPGNAPADKAPTVTTCDEHRGAPNGISYGWLAWDGENVVPGRKMKTDSNGSAVQGVNPKELTDLKRELAEAQEMNIEQAVMIGQLKRRLAAYDLPAAMAAMPWQK